MLVYRVASRKYAGDNSEGARLHGGRWNEPGTPVLYTSATRSLAAIEVIAHYGAIPADYRIIVFDIPEGLALEIVALDALQEGWPDEGTMPATAKRGSEWAQSMRTAVLQVPSAVMRAEFNYILNPLHPDFPSIRMDIPDTDFIDKRLRKPTLRRVPK